MTYSQERLDEERTYLRSTNRRDAATLVRLARIEHELRSVAKEGKRRSRLTAPARAVS